MENDYVIRIEELITETSTLPLVRGTLYFRDIETNAQTILEIIRKGLEAIPNATATLYTLDKAVITE